MPSADLRPEPSTAHPPLPRFGPEAIAWLALALVGTAVALAKGLDGELVYDDLLLIGRNPWITDLSNLPTLLARPYWDFLDPGTSEQIGYWRPLTAVVQAFAWAVGDGATPPFHAASLALHLGATLVAFLLVRRLTGRTRVAGGTALLFGLHPVHVESVVWISALNDPLFGLFSLLALLAFLRWRDAGSRGTPIAAGLAFFLGLLSKEMAVATLPMALALDLSRRRASGEPERKGWLDGFHGWRRAYRPFAIALALWVGCRMLVFGDVLAGFDRTPVHFGVDAARMQLLRLELLGGGLALLAWPVDLVTFRPFRPDLDGFELEIASMAVVVLVALALGLVLWLRRARTGLAALLLVPLAFSPVLVNVSSLGRFPLSDRFLYLPVLGFALLVAWLLDRIRLRAALPLVTLAIGGLYAVQSHARVGVWADEETLFETAVAETPRSAYLRWSLGRVLLTRLNETEDRAYLARALAAFEQAGTLLEEAKQRPTDVFVTEDDYLQTNLGLGQAYSFEGELDDYGSQQTAIVILEELERRLVEIQEQRRVARERGTRVDELDLAIERVYMALGQAYRLDGRRDEARAAFEKALAANPRFFEARLGLGRLLAEEERWDEAIDTLDEALALHPGDYEARLVLAQTLREGGQPERAEELALELVERDAKVAEPLLILAANRLAEGKAREALTWIDRALAARPEHAHAWYLKAMAMQALGVSPQATIEAFQRATDYGPDHFLAAYNYGSLLLASGAVEAAVPHLIRAYTLADDPALLGPLAAALAQLPVESADAFFRLAAADGTRGRLDTAELWLDRALALDPDHPSALFQKALLYRTRGRHTEALDLMRRACAGSPGDIPAHTQLGEYLWSRGLLVEALRTLNDCLAYPRPEAWSEAEHEASKRLLERMIADIEKELPPSPTIGPPAPGS